MKCEAGESRHDDSRKRDGEMGEGRGGGGVWMDRWGELMVGG